MLGIGTSRCRFWIRNKLPSLIRNGKTFYKLRNLLAFYEEFCHMELVGAYKIKEVILQMLGGGRY